jgi:hypothetical protein
MHAARGLLALAMVCVAATWASAAEWQLKPFIGATYGGSTTYNIVQLFPPKAHFVFGASGMFLGEFLGIEGDFGHTSGFFQDSNNPLVTDSGVMHIRIDYQQNVPNSSTLKAMDLGAGVTGFLTKRMGVSWDVRYFRSIDRTIETGQSVGPEHLSFWRANMAFAIRL